MMIKNILLLTIVASTLSSCVLWPYEKDFDCPVEEGIKCASIYEISEMADKGMFGPDAKGLKSDNCECHDKPVKKKNKNIKSKKNKRLKYINPTNEEYIKPIEGNSCYVGE